MSNWIVVKERRGAVRRHLRINRDCLESIQELGDIYEIVTVSGQRHTVPRDLGEELIKTFGD